MHAAFILLLLFFLSIGPAFSAAPEFRSTLIRQDPERFLEQALQQPAQGSSSYWLELAYAQMLLNQKESALLNIEQAIELAVLLDDHPLYQAQLYHIKAQIYGRLYRNTELGIEALLRAVQWLEPLQDERARKEKNELYESLAQAHLQNSDYPQAIYYAEKSLAEALLPQQELNAHFLLGRLHLQMNRINQAFAHLQSTLELATQLEAFHAYPLVQLRYGIGYQKMGLPEQALQAFMQAKEGFAKYQHERSYINSLLRVVSVQLDQNWFDEHTYAYLQEALQYSHQHGDAYSIAESKFYLGQWYLLHQDQTLANDYFEQAISIAFQINNRDLLNRVQLTLAESLVQQQELEHAEQLFQQLAIQPEDHNQALFLRYRYAELAAELAAWKHEWQHAFQYSQLARALRFDDLHEQYNLKLDYLHQNNPAPSTTSPHQATPPLYWLLSTLTALFLLTGAVSWLAWQRRRQQATPNQLIFSRQWIQFSEKLAAEQRQKQPLQLMAVTLRGCQQYKQRHGEVQLRRALVSLLQSLNSPEIIQMTIHSDVLWLGLSCQDDKLAALEQKVLLHLGQQRKALTPTPQLQTLVLPLQALLGQQFKAQHLQALREAVWLSWYLAEQLNPSDDNLYLQLKVLEQRPCEWMAENIRQDLLNALQLGSIELWQQQRLLNTSIKELLD
ncbi:hypothetical protein SAMN04488051_101425 [Alkalimonas amylolytica]|uniref:Uncharacterized protein n=2 Tax=Alkalimonas amylolytica TaxID=152573 RepID=A0A1H3XVX1_ALKAM|nr:hypothetical protein SAMN04488051_101425 [Alkalimonas amylolytica]